MTPSPDPRPQLRKASKVVGGMNSQGPLVHSPEETEWLRRYKARFIVVAGLTPEQAEACANAESFEVLSESFEDDPEGAADEEMSYWSD